MGEIVRLQKYIAMSGMASRRAAEQMIEEGRVKVNGKKVTEQGVKVEIGCDSVEVDNQLIKAAEKKIYIALNKPTGFVTTSNDQFDRPTVMNLVEKEIHSRVFPVGRLDYETEGLLLMTNDGDWANKVTHPSFECKKKYYAVLKGVLTIPELNKIRRGVVIDGRKTKPAECEIMEIDMGMTLVEITIHEGRNRQVRKMFEAVGHTVKALKRESVGIVQLGNLPEGRWRYLTSSEIEYFSKKNKTKIKNLKIRGVMIMKKILMMSVLALSMSYNMAMGAQLESGDSTVGLIINEEWASADQPPVIVNDRTLAPVRAVSEKLGFKVDWEAETGKVTVSKDNTNIVMHIGSTTITKNGETVETDVAPAILNERTIIPVRAVAELLDCTVEWNGDARTVFVNSPGAYAYYNSLSYDEKTYDESYTEIRGYLGRYVIEPDYILSGMPMEKTYIIPDTVCNVTVDDGWGNKNTFSGVKRIEIGFNESVADLDKLIGKRVVVKGKMAGGANRANSSPYIFWADSITADEELSFELDDATVLTNVLNTYKSVDGEEIKWAKLIDINKDGVNEMLVLDWAESMNVADLLLYSFTPEGAVKETFGIGQYSHSGIFSEGAVNMYVNDSYIVIENGVNGIGTDAEGNEFEKGTSYSRISVNDDGSIKREIAYYVEREEVLYQSGYDDTEEKECSQRDVELMIKQNSKGELKKLVEIVADYSSGTASMEINKDFFDTKDEVISQLSK